MVVDLRGISTREELTEALAALFREGAWSYQRLAAVAGLSPATVLSIVKGTRTPRPDTLRRFVEACGQDPAPWLRALGKVAELERPSGGGSVVDGRVARREFFRHLIDTHTTLFAGRSTETEQILGFVREEQTGYVFIEGLSGYGKTSLLAHLVDLRPDFCYHFVSQVYRRSGTGFDPTNPVDLLQSLCDQLDPARIPGESLRELELEFLGLLSRRRQQPTAIVVDGVDELEPPEQLRGLLPMRLPPGIVMVLSARTRGDRTALSDIGLSRTRLGLHIVLPGLGELALAELLRQIDGPAATLADDADFVGELHMVSRGDPFYLRFLVEDIAEGILDRSNIGRTPSGLEEYLDRQLAVLERSAHRPQHVELLGFILEAGVLSRLDLINLVDGLTWLNFERITNEIHRFLLMYDDHYSFCHDRFREYFWAKVGHGRTAD